MAVVRNLMVRAGADFSGLYQEMKKSQSAIAGFQSKVSGAMAKVGVALGAVGAGFAVQQMIQDAMKVEGAVGSINRLMGESATQFEDWAKTSAAAFGMSQSDALQFGRTYANIISGFAGDTGTTMQYTQELLKTSAVVASNMGMSMTETMDRIRSGMLGNTEAIEDLGINVNVAMIESTNAFKKFAGSKSWQQLDFQTQQQIRYFAILEQAGIKFGNSMANNTSTQLLVLNAQLSNIKLALGQAFLPILNVVVPILTTFANKLSASISNLSDFTKALFGSKTQKATNKQSDAVNNVSKSYDKAKNSMKGAANAQKGFLAGFDEVNAIAEKSAASNGVDTTATALDQVNNANTNKTLKVETPDVSAWEKFGKSVRETFDAFAPLIVTIGTFLGILGAAKLALVAWDVATKAVIAVQIAWNAALAANPIGLTIAAIAALTAGIIYAYTHSEQFRIFVDKLFVAIKALGTYIATGFMIAWNAAFGIMKGIYTWIETVFILQFTLLKTAVTLSVNVIKTVFSGLWTFVSGVFTGNWSKAMGGIKSIAIGVFDAIKSAVNSVVGGIASAIDKIISLANKAINAINKLPGIDLPTIPKISSSIPKLARGGVVSSPTIAQIGEAGKEMVVPLENTQFVDKLAGALGTAVMTAMQMGGSAGGGGANIVIDGVALARAIQPYTSKESTRIGNSMIVAR